MRIIVKLIVAAVWFTIAVPAIAVEYWPMNDGAVYHYVNSDGWTQTVTISGNVQERIIIDGINTCLIIEEFRIDADGDVYLVRSSESCQGMEEREYSYEPEVKFLEFPLVVGDTRIVPTVVHVGVSIQPIEFEYIIMSEETVTVPYGTFDVVVVVEDAWWAHRAGVYYLNREVGPVKLRDGFELVSIEGPVGTSHATWGSLKSLYR